MNILKFPPALATKTKCSAVSHPGSIGRVLAAILIVLTLVGFGERVARAQDSTVLVSLKNVASSGAVRCVVHLAHWFAHDLGRLQPGQRAEFVVRVQQRTKLVTMKNDAGVDMAVEGIHCAMVGGPRQLADWISADALRDKRGQVEFVCGSGVIFRCHAVAIKP